MENLPNIRGNWADAQACEHGPLGIQQVAAYCHVASAENTLTPGAINAAKLDI